MLRRRRLLGRAPCYLSYRTTNSRHFKAESSAVIVCFSKDVDGVAFATALHVKLQELERRVNPSFELSLVSKN